MTGISKYCTIADLELIDSQRHLMNCVIDRSGASIEDYDVVRNLENYISTGSTDLEAQLRRYTDVPIDPTETALTGTYQFIRGSTTVTIIGGLATTELVRGDEVRPNTQEDIRLIVDSITGDTEIELINVFYYETDIASLARKYTGNIPKEVRQLTRDHTSYLIWERRKSFEDNPHKDREADYRRAIDEIRIGKYRFTTAGGTEIRLVPTLTDLTVEKIMIDNNFDGYTLNPDDTENHGEREIWPWE